MIFVVHFQVLGQVQYALREQRNLDLGRTCVTLVLLVFADGDCFEFGDGF